MPAIAVSQLSKSFRTYKKQPGFAGAIRGLFRRKYDASRHDESRFALSDESDKCDRVRARIVRVDYVGAPLARDCSELARRANIPLAPQRKSIGRQAGLIRLSNQGRSGRGDDQCAIAQVTQSGGEEKYLTLAAAPTAPRVDVKDPGQVHYASSCFANALNRPRSHDSTESVISSGCH